MCVPGRGKCVDNGGHEAPELAAEELVVGGQRSILGGPSVDVAPAEKHEERCALREGPERQQLPGEWIRVYRALNLMDRPVSAET